MKRREILFRVVFNGKLASDPDLIAKYFRAVDAAGALRMAQLSLGPLPEGTAASVEK